jgi:hypothetical protein
VEYKNVQRRVYDAINVLMALGLVTKEKQGVVRFNEASSVAVVPNKQGMVSQSKNGMQNEMRVLKISVAKKRRKMQELIMQRNAIQSLIDRNRDRCLDLQQHRIDLPFLLVSMRKTCLEP